MGVLKNLFGKKESVNPYPMLKARSLATTAQDLNLAPTDKMPAVFGMLMEQNMGAASVVLLAFAEGSVSLYFSNGGGIIGAGEHATVRKPALDWIALAQTTYSIGSPNQKSIGPGEVQFTWRGFAGNVFASAREEEIQSESHPLYPMYAAGQNVITEIRKMDEARSRRQ